MKHRRREISTDRYLGAANYLIDSVAEGTIKILDVEISDHQIFRQLERMVTNHNLDIADALQVLTIQLSFEKLPPDRDAILITADQDLGEAARKEGLSMWDCEKQSPP